MKNRYLPKQPFPHMDDALLVSQLEEVARMLCITVRRESMDDEDFSSTGGFCRVQNQRLIIIDSKASPHQQASILAKALRLFDVSQLYLRPGVRAFLETAPEKHTIASPRKRR